MKKQQGISWQSIVPPEEVKFIKNFIESLIENYLNHKALFSNDLDRSMVRGFGYPPWLQYYDRLPDVLFTLLGKTGNESGETAPPADSHTGRLLVAVMKQAFKRRVELERDVAAIEELRLFWAQMQLPLRLGLLVVINSIACSVIFRESVSSLIERARAGDDQAMIDLVSVDHAFLFMPEISNRIKEATLFCDEGFLEVLGDTISYPPLRTELAKHRDDLFLLIAWEFGFEGVGLEQFGFFLREIGFERYQDATSLRRKLNRLGIFAIKSKEKP